MNGARPILTLLDERIAARVREIITQKPSWPCGKGCDGCCRSLGEIPNATIPEWERLFEGVKKLPDSVQTQIDVRLDALIAAPNVQPIVCPFLDRSKGACLVYEHRLLACRAYGFFASSDAGRWCEQIEKMADKEKEHLVFGNFDALFDEARRFMGETVSLTEWRR